jgi:hypothetical protein
MRVQCSMWQLGSSSTSSSSKNTSSSSSLRALRGPPKVNYQVPVWLDTHLLCPVALCVQAPSPTCSSQSAPEACAACCDANPASGLGYDVSSLPECSHSEPRALLWLGCWVPAVMSAPLCQAPVGVRRCWVPHRLRGHEGGRGG